MRIAAAVILYHPSENVIANIDSYYDYVEEIFVFDNTETGSLVGDSIAALPKVTFFADYENKGIAARLNTACNLSIEKLFDWLLTMDQDTKFSEEAIQIYFNCFHNYEKKAKVAMFGTDFKRSVIPSTPVCKGAETDRLITSGMLLNLSAYKQIGRFDEALFIDLIDDEYCIAARKAGYSIIQFRNVIISHNLGTQVYASSVKSLFLVKKKKEIHTPLRCYYMYRNMLYIEAKYKRSGVRLAKNIRRIVESHIKVCVLYGRKTWPIIRYLLAARSDFKNNKMGRIEKEL